jgi:arabinose-5-phosphate isomerase
MDAQAIDSFLDTQLSAVRSASSNDARRIASAVDALMRSHGKIVVSGIGKSGHIGMKIASTMTSLGAPAVFVHPSEAFHGDLGLIGKTDSVILLSHSGETRETVRLLQHLKRLGTAVVGVTGNPDSTLAKESSVALTYAVADEGSPFNIAPMASTTAMLVIGDLLACALCLRSGFSAADFAASHPGGSLGLQLTRVSEFMKGPERLPIVREIATFDDALEEMNRCRLGVTSVVDAYGRMVGVFTDGDIRRFLLSESFDRKAPITTLMIKDPKTIGPETSLQEAMRLMEDLRVMVLFVTDAGNRPVGVIHMHHIVEGKIV